jgi:hypothetical protein
VRSAVDPTSDLYYAGADDGAVYAGPSGGSWQQIFTHPSGARVTGMEVDTNGGAIFVTFGGTAFFRVYKLFPGLVPQDITMDLPGGQQVWSVAADRSKADQLYVGTDTGVLQGVSNSGGSAWSWRQYRVGLPPAQVIDLEFHPLTGVLRCATFGRGAFEVQTMVHTAHRLAIARNADGRLEVFVRGNNGDLWHIWQTSPYHGWSNWESLGANFPSGPVVGQNADGRLEVFVRGNNGDL